MLAVVPVIVIVDIGRTGVGALHIADGVIRRLGAVETVIAPVVVQAGAAAGGQVDAVGQVIPCLYDLSVIACRRIGVGGIVVIGIYIGVVLDVADAVMLYV